VREFLNKVLRRIFGPKGDEVNSSLNIIPVITYRRMVWSVFSTYEGRGAYRVLVGNPERKNHLEDPSIDQRIISKWIFSMLEGGVGEMDRIDLAHVRDRLSALVYAVMNPPVS
jgi:hypothetical protein